MIRRRICFFGHVQGVGFRYITCSVARGFCVNGYVRNRPDGSVELVVEGESQEIQRFLDSFCDLMSSHIERTEIIKEPSTAFLNESGSA